MANIEVLGGISVPYQQDEETKSWTGTAGHSWKVENSHVQAFAKEADLKIRKRTKNHGKIPFPPKLNSLANSLDKHLKIDNKIDFKKFVEIVQKVNSIALKTSRAKSKLVLIFLKYKIELEGSTEDTPKFIENILVVLLKDKSALMFGDDGSPLGTDIIDFDDVMQAAMIDVAEFSTSITNKQDIDISFINGSGGTTNYFIEFFDAEDVIKNKESVTNVLKALDDFSITLGLSRTQREFCEGTVQAHIEHNERNHFTTKLQELSHVIYSALKKDKTLDLKSDSFGDFVQEYNYKVNEEFNVSKNERDTLEFISMETEVGKLKLKKSLFSSKGTPREITFNDNTNELTIKTKISDPQDINDLKKIQNG